MSFYNRDEKCLQRGTDWGFKGSSLRFAFKGLIQRYNLTQHNFITWTFQRYRF